MSIVDRKETSLCTVYLALSLRWDARHLRIFLVGFVPYFSDNGSEPEDQLTELYQMVECEKRLEIGAVLKEEQGNTEIDLIL